MNIFKKVIFRLFQFGFKVILPILPYKDPIILNSINEIIPILKRKEKVLIVTDKNIIENGLTKDLEEILKNHDIDYYIYDEVVANPTSDNVEQALKIYKERHLESIIAIGGGSPIDCAKAVGAMVVKPNKTILQLKGVLKVRKKIPLLIAIPTTAGTGSETTLASVIVDSKTRHKCAINDFVLIPPYAVLDETLTMTMPQEIVSTTGMDALTHAIESYIGRSGNKNTRKDALDAIKLIFENIEKSYFEFNKTARKNMSLASFLAGKSFSKAYVGNIHALAHALGGKYNIPHGLANAIILPIVLKEYGKVIYKKLYNIALYCNLVNSNESYENATKIVIEKIELLNKKLNIPKNIGIIQDNDIPLMSHYAYKEANPLYPVPLMWDEKDFQKMYMKIKNN